MDLPRVDPVGLLDLPESARSTPRRFAAWQRWAAAAVISLFAMTTLLTTVLSLGRYCLTTDGADTRELEWRKDRSPSEVRQGRG